MRLIAALSVVMTLSLSACTNIHPQPTTLSTDNVDNQRSAPDKVAFIEACVAGMVTPAKQDYAAAARRAGNAQPKPFPEEEFSTSAASMCECLADRLQDNQISYADVSNHLPLVESYIQEAWKGGQCRPNGLLGKIIDNR